MRAQAAHQGCIDQASLAARSAMQRVPQSDCQKRSTARRLVVKLDEEKSVMRDFMDWVAAEAARAPERAAAAAADGAADTVRAPAWRTRCCAMWPAGTWGVHGWHA
jgi:hypothetical protein